MAKVLGFLHRLEWSSPYTNPPDGQERVKVEMFIPANVEGCRQCPREIEAAYKPGDGYSHSVRAITEFPREMSRDVLKSIRQKRLARRMEEKFPLFADQFIQEEMVRKKDYYDGITDAVLVDKRNEVKEAHRQLLENWGLKS